MWTEENEAHLMADLHSERKSEHQKDLRSYLSHSIIEYGLENWLKSNMKNTTFYSSSKWWKTLRERDKDIEWKWAIETEWKIEKKKINRCQAMKPTTEWEVEKKSISITEKYMLTVK